jgi:hypothetical protein
VALRLLVHRELKLIVADLGLQAAFTSVGACGDDVGVASYDFRDEGVEEADGPLLAVAMNPPVHDAGPAARAIAFAAFCDHEVVSLARSSAARTSAEAYSPTSTLIPSFEAHCCWLSLDLTWTA